MEDGYERPNLTLVFHDPRMPVRNVLRALRTGLRQDFLFRSMSMRQGSISQAEALVVRFRVDAKTKELEQQGVAVDIAGRRRAHCDLMDGLQVPNGNKAIERALHLHWSAVHSELYGEPASASTVKRWRADARRKRASWGGTHGRRAGNRRRYDASEAAGRIRRRHAVRVVASGMPVRHGYSLAMAELERVNAGTHALYGPAASKISPFSYETFRRECNRVPVQPGHVRRRPRTASRVRNMKSR